jgi:hypothetical protein
LGLTNPAIPQSIVITYRIISKGLASSRYPKSTISQTVRCFKGAAIKAPDSNPAFLRDGTPTPTLFTAVIKLQATKKALYG